MLSQPVRREFRGLNKLSTSADFSSLSADFTDHQIRLKGIKTPHML